MERVKIQYRTTAITYPTRAQRVCIFGLLDFRGKNCHGSRLSSACHTRAGKIRGRACDFVRNATRAMFKILKVERRKYQNGMRCEKVRARHSAENACSPIPENHNAASSRVPRSPKRVRPTPSHKLRLLRAPRARSLFDRDLQFRPLTTGPCIGPTRISCHLHTSEFRRIAAPRGLRCRG